MVAKCSAECSLMFSITRRLCRVLWMKYVDQIHSMQPQSKMVLALRSLRYEPTIYAALDFCCYDRVPCQSNSMDKMFVLVQFQRDGFLHDEEDMVEGALHPDAGSRKRKEVEPGIQLLGSFTF